MEGGVNELRRDTKTTEHFDGKVSKVRVPAKDSPHQDQQDSVNGRHDHDGADPVRPRPVFEAPLNTKSFGHSRTHQLQRHR